MLNANLIVLCLALCLGWAVYATLALHRARHAALGLGGITLVALLCQPGDVSAVEAGQLIELTVIAALGIAVGRKLAVEALYRCWRRAGASIGTELAGWEPFFAWYPVPVGDAMKWFVLLERNQVVHPAGSMSWIYREAGS